jgi:hypothetical protein
MKRFNKSLLGNISSPSIGVKRATVAAAQKPKKQGKWLDGGWLTAVLDWLDGLDREFPERFRVFLTQGKPT